MISANKIVTLAYFPNYSECFQTTKTFEQSTAYNTQFQGIATLSSTLKMKAADSLETLLTYQITWCHIPEEQNPNIYRDENLKSQIMESQINVLDLHIPFTFIWFWE